MARSRSSSNSLPGYQERDARDDFLTIPLKNARIVSLKSLESGDEDDVDEKNSFWRRVTMPLRSRKTARAAPQELEPLKAEESEEKVPRPWYRPRITPLRATYAAIASVVSVLAFFGAVHLANVGMSMVPILWDDDQHTFLPEWGQDGKLGAGLASYPTDFTRDVKPVPIHSHNDYWRRVPLYQALHFGCTGVEADVWLFDNELYVGHNTMSLTRNRTLRSLYVDPLVEILDKQNPHTEFTNTSRNGVFDENPEQTLVLLIDFKNSGSAIWPALVEQLSAFREKNYLTYWDGQNTTQGPITVVATGNAPFDLVTQNTTYRDIFFDAPLGNMWEDPMGGFPEESEFADHPPTYTTTKAKRSSLFSRDPEQGNNGVTSRSTFDLSNSYYASVSFNRAVGRIWGGRLSGHQMRTIRGQIQGAKRRGLKVRYWDTPSWPIGLRNHVWEILVREGVDYLNADDLRAAARADWKRRRHQGWLL